MPEVVVLADEATAAGFRLAGVETRSPPAADIEAEFALARAGARLVVLSRSLAEALPPAVLQAAFLKAPPLVAVMPAITDADAPSGVRQSVRRVLGIES